MPAVSSLGRWNAGSDFSPKCGNGHQYSQDLRKIITTEPGMPSSSDIGQLCFHLHAHAPRSVPSLTEKIAQQPSDHNGSLHEPPLSVCSCPEQALKITSKATAFNKFEGYSPEARSNKFLMHLGQDMHATKVRSSLSQSKILTVSWSYCSFFVG